MADINKDSKPLFSIFIPTWNNLLFLKLCVESIEKNSTYKHEILIHVNDGSDGTLDWVREKGYKHTHSVHNIGVCWAMNTLRTIMTTEYIAYINDDMYVCPGWDKVLFDEIRSKNTKKWYIGSTLIEPGRTRQECYVLKDYGRSPETFREDDLLKEYSKFHIDDWQGATNPPTVVHRDIWDLIGGYSIEFTPGMASDPDFNAKLWMAGVREFKGLGKSLVYHFQSVSVGRVRRNRGPLQFLLKWGVTVRVFRRRFLNIDRPWAEPAPLDYKGLRMQLWRGRIKELVTVFKDRKTATLWNPDDIK